MKQKKYWIMLTLCNLFWAGNYVFGKFVLSEISPISLTFTRWFFACFLLFPIAHIVEKPNWKEAIKSWPIFMILAGLGYVGYNTILYTALKYTSSTNAALLNGLEPGMIILMSAVVFKDKITWRTKVGFVISLLGVVGILTNGHILSVFSMTYNRGDLVMLAAITMWTIYSIVGKGFTKVKPITTTAFSGFFTMLMLSPFALREGFVLGGISSHAVLGLVYIVVFPSVLSFIFWNVSANEIGPSQAGIFLNLNPVFTAVISVLVGAELYVSQVIGGALVLFGVSLTTGALENFMQKNKKRDLVRTHTN